VTRPTATNPPWADKILERYWLKIGAAARALKLPMPASTEGGQMLLEEGMIKEKPEGELGCGYYGFVYRSKKDGIVFKVSTDQSEAYFVAAYLKLRGAIDPSGIVKYHGIIALPEESYKKRNVFVLWREEAFHVGSDYNGKPLYGGQGYRFLQGLGDLKKTAGRVRDIAVKKEKRMSFDDYFEWIDNSFLREQPLVSRLYEDIDNLAYNTPYGSHIGQCFSEFLERGLLLADVHGGNIGWVKRPRNEVGDDVYGPDKLFGPVITDPGHVLTLKRDLAKITIPSIEDFK
jgi:hypothetical protein